MIIAEYIGAEGLFQLMLTDFGNIFFWVLFSGVIDQNVQGAEFIHWSWPPFVDIRSFEEDQKVEMPRTRPTYPPEFRRPMIKQVYSGRTPRKLTPEFDPSAQTIMNWVAQAERDTGVRHQGVTSVERDEL